jgi:hypothetical protein
MYVGKMCRHQSTTTLQTLTYFYAHNISPTFPYLILRLSVVALFVADISDPASVERHTNTLRLFNALFSVIHKSSELGLRKPNANMFKSVCAALRVNPQETLFVDDLPSNLRCTCTESIPARSPSQQQHNFLRAEGLTLLECKPCVLVRTFSLLALRTW